MIALFIAIVLALLQPPLVEARWTDHRTAVISWPADAGEACVFRSRDAGATWYLMDCDDDGAIALTVGGGDAFYRPAYGDVYQVQAGGVSLGVATLGAPPGTVFLPLAWKSP